MELENNSTSESALKQNIDVPDVENHEDVPDIPPKSSKISNLDIFFQVFSIAMHCCDVCMDVSLVVRYIVNQKLSKFAWTSSLILIPSFINTIISLEMYHQDKEKNLPPNEQPKKQPICKRIGRFFVVTFIIVFQFTMAQRSYYSLKYALQSRRCKSKNDRVGQQKYFIKMLKEEQDIALLRVLECFIEAAPQLILQLSIFVQDYHGEFEFMMFHQVGSIVASFISLAWAMVSYHRNIRLAQLDKTNINFAGSVLQFLWHLFITTSRIACVSAVAVFSTVCVIASCFFHWIGMSIWIIMESRGIVNFCQKKNRAPHLPTTLRERVKSTLFSCVLGFVYIFIYIHSDDSGTYSKHLFYYTICFLENIAAAILVVLSVPTNLDTVWYHYVISSTCIVPFIIGVTIMIFYYVQFHPSMKHQTFTLSKILKFK